MEAKDTEARALLIQNRLSDPQGLGLSHSPAYYFSHHRKARDTDRRPLEEIPDKSNFEEGDVQDVTALYRKRCKELREILARKQARRQDLEQAIGNASQGLQRQQDYMSHLQSEEAALAGQYYEKILAVRQDRVVAEEAAKRLEATLEDEEALCMEKTRVGTVQQSSFLEAVSKCSALEALNSTYTASLSAHQIRLNDLRDISSAYLDTTVSLQGQSIANRHLLKELNNQLQELKGNIRVFCRVRPLLPEDQSQQANISVLGGNRLKVGEQVFRFDRVFDQTSSQAIIFEDISQLVQSAVDGYKVSIFAYGQTGSGKTYTMEGPSDCTSESYKGVIQRSVEQVFGSAEEMKRLGWIYRLKAAFTEVYNEQVRDLLEGSKVMTAFSTNLLEPTTVEVQRPEHLYELLAKARQQRAVAQTQCNTHSSRSHSLFRLSIEGANEREGKSTRGVLHLVDLAGSERLDEQGEEGRRTETIAINSSLSALGDVINAMARKSAHIPFRNSKLTSIMKDCLGADSKTLMFLNISPSVSRLTETLRSLKFGSKVAKCNLTQQRTK